MSAPHVFSLPARLLHWTMAALILFMLFLGVSMVTSNTHYSTLVAVHRPVGILILVLAAIRLIYRLLNPPPPLPPTLPRFIAVAARASHVALYALMFATPLVGWAMLSAGGYPVEVLHSVHLPAIAPQDARLYASLRHAHTFLALLLLLVFLIHLAAALAHGLIFKDGVFESMASAGRSDGHPSRGDYRS